MIIFLIPSFLLHLLVGILLFRDITSYCIFVYLYLAVADLRCCTWAFSSCGEQGLLLVAVRQPALAVASLVAEHKI